MTTQLNREFRFFWRGGDLPAKSANSWGGWNSSLQIGIPLALQVTVEGPVERPSGYICNIKLLDDTLREAFNRAVAEVEPLQLSFLELLNAIAAALPSQFFKQAGPQSTIRLVGLRLVVSPQLSFGCSFEESEMLTITQQFEFSAAHRLNCRELSAEQNQDLFGKCNNPNGHGHNYIVEITAGLPERDESSWNLSQFEATVKRMVIDRFDHRHLNEDVSEFRELNPSVENIADICYRLLERELAPLELVNVRVYETPKTWADRSARRAPK
jgi:6-pyruvoyltetrahydropterin/6-carboxytetrahydropterin synthase